MNATSATAAAQKEWEEAIPQPGRVLLHVWCSDCGKDTRIDVVGLAPALQLLKSCGWRVDEVGQVLCPRCERE